MTSTPATSASLRKQPLKDLMRIVRQRGNRSACIVKRALPSPGAGEVLIKTAASALCGSELASYRNEGNGEGNLGHEAAGVVVELGSGVEGLLPGQRVGVSAIAGCGECRECHLGRYTWCDRFAFYGNMHADYFVARAQACHLLPDDVPWDVGVLISGDGLGVPFHTSRKIVEKSIENIVIFGMGPIGLGNVLLQSHLGRRVIAVELSIERLRLARSLGAAETIEVSASIDIPSAVRDILGGDLADVCIEASGVPLAAKQCFKTVRKGGRVIFNGEQPALELSPSEDFIRRDITATGAWFYHFNEYPEMLELFRKGLPVQSLITHRFPLEEIATAYRAMEDGSSGKVIIEYQENTD